MIYNVVFDSWSKPPESILAKHLLGIVEAENLVLVTECSKLPHLLYVR